MVLDAAIFALLILATSRFLKLCPASLLIIFQLRSVAAPTVGNDDEFVHRVGDGAYYLRLELSFSHRFAFTAVLLYRRDVQTWAVGEKGGINAECALIVFTAYEGHALRLPIFTQCALPMPSLLGTTALTSWSKFAHRFLPACKKTVSIVQAKRAAETGLANCSE